MAIAKTDLETLMKMAATLKATLVPSDIAQLIRMIEPTPSTGEMTQEQFERLLLELAPKNNRPGYSAKSIEVARLILVMGASVPEAAADAAIALLREQPSARYFPTRKACISMPSIRCGRR